MVQKSGKGKRKSIRKQRWAAVIASIIAVGMLLSSVIVYFGSMMPRGDSAGPDQDFNPEASRDHYRQKVEGLEEYIKEYGPTAAVWQELAENYQNLVMIQQVFFDEPDTLLSYQEAMLEAYRSLIELEPGEPGHYLQYMYAYREVAEDPLLVLEHLPNLTRLLHEKPEPRHSLALVGFLISMEQEELAQEESAWLRDYLEQKLAEDDLDNLGRYYYAVLLAEYQDDTGTSLEQLALILETETEGSELYLAAENYRKRLQPEEDAEDDQ